MAWLLFCYSTNNKNQFGQIAKMYGQMFAIKSGVAPSPTINSMEWNLINFPAGPKWQLFLRAIRITLRVVSGNIMAA